MRTLLALVLLSAVVARADAQAGPLLSDARLARLAPAHAAAWRAYLARSRAAHARDTASMHAELRRVGRDTMRRAPYAHDFDPQPWMTAAWLASDSGRAVVDAVLSYQAPNGGWSKHVDYMRGPRAVGQSYFAESNEWAWISTLDNDATTGELRFLARADRAHPDPRRAAAFRRGVEYLLAAQYPNGCWPQSYPLDGGYHDAATFNDRATVNALDLLGEVADGEHAFVPASTRDSARRAIAAGLDCVLASQVVVRGVRTIWGQQHDPLTLAPTSARSYELTSLASLESVAIVDYLMRLPRPSARAVRAVHSAADWFRSAAIRGYAYDRFELRADDRAGPLWARLNEIGTNRPLFANRDGITLYDADRLTDRRQGYLWFTDAPVAMLRRYDRWAARYPR